jgi:hypothetical protein
MWATAATIRAAVERRFAQIALSPGQEQKFPVGPASAKKLGYDTEEIDALPPSATESFCGVGNPLGLGEPDRDVLWGCGHRYLHSGVKHGATSPCGRESRPGRSHRSDGGDTP